MGRAPCCDKANVKKGPWSPEEDSKLKEYIEKNGTGGNWIALPQKAGLKRCGKSCRLRWLNYLRPNIRHGEFSDEEDRIICTLFASIGSRWSIIAAQLPGRTDNDIKNYWNTKLKKKLMAMASNSQRKPPPFPSSNHHHQNFPLPSPNSYSSYINPSTTDTTTEPFTAFDPILSQISSLTLLNSNNNNNSGSSLATNSSSCSLLFQESMVSPSPMQYSNLLVFGTEASCSSNSDGSCSQISYGGGRREVKQEENIGFQSYVSSGFEENISQKFMLSYGSSHNSDGSGENLAQGYFGESTLGDYAILEDVKQMISARSNNDNNFLVDENKTSQHQQQHQRDEKVMYYYYP